MVRKNEINISRVVLAAHQLTILSWKIIGVAFLLLFLFGITVILPVNDIGYLAIGSIVLYTIAFLTSIISLVIILLNPKEAQGLLATFFALLVSFAPAIFVVESFRVSRARIERQKKTIGKYNINILGKAVLIYAESNSGILPTSENWCDVLLETNSDVSLSNFKHPKPKMHGLKGKCHFAFNENVSGMDITAIDPKTVILFESDGEWGLSGGQELLERVRNKHSYVSVFLADGSIEDYLFRYNAYKSFDSGEMEYEELTWVP
jgi:hypothetical protein